MTEFPNREELVAVTDEAVDLNWSQLVLTREPVLKALEEARNKKEISGSLEAKVVIQGNGDSMDVYETHKADLPALFIVSKVSLVNRGDLGLKPGVFSVVVERAEGAKCERCWNYSTRVGESAEWPTVCERCVAALEEIKSYGPEYAAAQQARAAGERKDRADAGAGGDASNRGAS
jgi:isoleucyl-tRNA synthetase